MANKIVKHNGKQRDITISFVVPVYNEESRLDKTFQALENLVIPRGPLRKSFSEASMKLEKVIFVDDGSTDSTFEILQKYVSVVIPGWTRNPKQILKRVQNDKISVTIVSYKPNRGKGYAIRTGMLEATSDYTLFFDADVSTPLSELVKFAPLMKKGVEVIIGTRKNGRSTVVVHQPFYRELLGKGFTLLTSLILNIWVTDFTCGFKAFKNGAKEQVFSKTRINRWGYDAEVIFLAKKLGLTCAEKPVMWSHDARSKVNVLKDIPQTLFELVKILWDHQWRPFLLSLRERTNEVRSSPASGADRRENHLLRGNLNPALEDTK